MKRFITHIIQLLLLATAVVSCSAAAEPSNPDMNDGMVGSPGRLYPVKISGQAIDIDTGEALEDIRITVSANEDSNTFLTKTAYTGNDGKFELSLKFENYATVFVAIADDLNGRYESSRHDMLVSWDAIYNVEEGVFLINGCDFHLKKIE